MSSASNIHSKDQLEEFSTLEHDPTVSLATLDDVDSAEAPEVEYTGPHCEKCEAPLKSDVVAICRKCGWYSSLGTFVEVDPAWETELEETSPAVPALETSHVRVWLDMIPRWGWVIIGSVLAVIIESVVARLVTSAESSLRTTWSLTQLAIGAVVAIGCHVFNFLALIANDAEVGLLDPLLKPIRLWVRTCHNLPKRLKLVNATACGLTAIMMSLVVIGGIPYDRLWDWGVKERPKQNLMGAVMDRMKKLDNGKGSDNLEDAVKDFAGKQNLDADNNNIEKPKPALPQQRADCVILGYQLDRDRRISSLVLGTASRSRLVFAGRVTPSLSDDEAEELLESLHAITVNKPFIRIPVENMLWVQPKLTCRITYMEQFKDGRFRGLQWDKLLGAIDLKTTR